MMVTGLLAQRVEGVCDDFEKCSWTAKQPIFYPVR
jgi:hypothetical protein